MSPRVEADQLLGVPYLEDGRDPAAGLNCWGLCMLKAREHGLELPDVLEEMRAQWQGGQLDFGLMFPGWEHVDAESMRTGDVVELRQPYSEVPSHVAFCEDGLLWSCEDDERGVVRHPASRLRRLIVRVWRARR